jgi:hypothetical protein
MTDTDVDWRPDRVADCLVLTPRGDLDQNAFGAVRRDLAAFAMDRPRAIVVVVDDLRIRSWGLLPAFWLPEPRASGWPAVPIVLVARDPALRATVADVPASPVHASLDDALGELAGIPPRRTAAIELPPVAASSRRARVFVDTTSQRWNLPDHAPDAATVTVELVENSIVHAGTDLRLRLEPHNGGLVVAVRDGSPHAVPHERDRRPGGLRVVAHLAAEWGWSPDASGGKVVWAVLAT